MSKVMLKSKKGKKGEESEEYPLLNVEEAGKTTVEPVIAVTTSSSVPAELLITSKADKKSRKRSKAVSGM